MVGDSGQCGYFPLAVGIWNETGLDGVGGGEGREREK
jgi:hypothetical protein